MPDIITRTSDAANKRLREVASGEFAPEVYVRDKWSAAVALGRAFVATSDRITTDAVNTHIVGLIANPANSGMLVTVMQVVSNIAPDTMVVGRVRKSPTGGLPTVPYTPFNVKSLAGATEVSVGTFAVNAAGGGLTGGEETDLFLTAHKGREEFALGIPLGPGASLGVHIPLGLVGGGDGTFAAYLTQEEL